MLVVWLGFRIGRRATVIVGGFELSVDGVVPSRLPELALIDAIDALADVYTARVGQRPINVSHWDPSEHLSALLRSRTPALSIEDTAPYRYSYLLRRTPQVLEKLGFASQHARALIAENGTSCIAAVANWLNLRQISEVTLLTPYYFTTPYNLRRLGISVREVPAQRNGSYGLPSDLKISRGQALWLTNPIYSTGMYSLELYIDQLVEIADSGVVIISDEALALGPSRIGARLGGHRNYISISSPHKSICVNGLKFSAIVFHSNHLEVFEDWADILSGGLSIAAVAAVDHFLTPAFDRYQTQFVSLINETRKWHSSIVLEFMGRIRTDQQTKGHFVTTYVPHFSAQTGSDLKFLSDILNETGCILIPGTRSGFDESYGFCFRVNLAQDSDEFRSSLSRLYRFLASTDCDFTYGQRRQARPSPSELIFAALLNN
jgi:aspartate/methionine/tyrosine aminotransferase